MASATVWRVADGFRVSIEIRDPITNITETSTHSVSGDAFAVRDLIAREVGKYGLDAGACGIWWKLTDLMPLAKEPDPA